jgi:hypothetical protein
VGLYRVVLARGSPADQYPKQVVCSQGRLTWG